MESYPRLSARTRRFTLGTPRAFQISPDGSQVLFLRTGSGTDAVHNLWRKDCETGDERPVVQASDLLGSEDEDLPAEEKARRERARETAGGIVSYAVDRDHRLAVFSLSGRLFRVEVATGSVTELTAQAGVFDPRLDPSGGLVAYAAAGELRVTDGEKDSLLASDSDPDVVWGAAEFVAAEEMGRSRGFWWSPDGQSLVATRVDNRPVLEWHLGDPTNPADSVRSIRYPAAGTDNAVVTLHHVTLDGTVTGIGWDREAYPYLAEVIWDEGSPLTIVVQSRDQKRFQVLTVDALGEPAVSVAERESASWVSLVPGSPRWLDVGWLVAVAEDAGNHRLFVDAKPVTPIGLEVRRLISVAGGTVLFTASEDPTEVHLWKWDIEAGAHQLTRKSGVHSAVAGGDVRLEISSSLDSFGPVFSLRRDERLIGEIESVAETPPVEPKPKMLRLGERDLRAALFLPTGGGSDPLPVLLDPYGGPGAQRVLADRSAHLGSQWLADQGFAVLVIDGRGTPGRGLEWERAIHHDFATAVLEDQVDGLAAAAAREPRLDVSRVGIRGWSFGGYLAALAVLRRPDIFHAAVAGAPVTDWRLYDTHYTERYLGHPDQHPEAYKVSSLIDDAPSLERPLLLIHGLADDNVVAAHSLQLSRALTEAGRAHSFLPLSGVSHMTPQEVVAENLMLLQVSFFTEMLGAAPLG